MGRHTIGRVKPRYSVKEYWEATPEEKLRLRINPSSGDSTTYQSTVHKAHKSLFMASLELIRRRKCPSYGPDTQFMIVDHDAEMRRWNRYDFILNPTQDDKIRALTSRLYGQVS
jgi:hypothetical protein